MKHINLPRVDIFDELATKIRSRTKQFFKSVKAYFKRLLLPVYLFPVKLITYSAYYSLKLLVKLIFKTVKGIILALIWPFRRLSNFFKTLFWLSIFSYFAFTEYRFLILIADRYGSYIKFFCQERNTKDKLRQSVVRVVGGFSEGSGFFVSSNQVLTNFHVIDGEPSPKIIFPDGSFITPVKITANKNADLALLYLNNNYPDFSLAVATESDIAENEQLLAAGYPLGSDLPGEVTILKGNANADRSSKTTPVSYLQSDISLVAGMSGGPVVDRCGEVIGVNTAGLAGLSLFIISDSFTKLWDTFTEEAITKIDVDPSASPQQAVEAFYTYLKTRRMEDGFNLLSQEYLQKTNFEEWTNRFKDILDVQIYLTQGVPKSKDTVFVKFSTKNWDGREVAQHYYEGTWQTVWEDGVYKMLKSKILEVENPGWDWFY
jgi:hypothetical protein